MRLFLEMQSNQEADALADTDLDLSGVGSRLSYHLVLVRRQFERDICPTQLQWLPQCRTYDPFTRRRYGDRDRSGVDDVGDGVLVARRRRGLYGSLHGRRSFDGIDRDRQHKVIGSNLERKEQNN